MSGEGSASFCRAYKKTLDPPPCFPARSIATAAHAIVGAMGTQRFDLWTGAFNPRHDRDHV